MRDACSGAEATVAPVVTVATSAFGCPSRGAVPPSAGLSTTRGRGRRRRPHAVRTLARGARKRKRRRPVNRGGAPGLRVPVRPPPAPTSTATLPASTVRSCRPHVRAAAREPAEGGWWTAGRGGRCTLSTPRAPSSAAPWHPLPGPGTGAARYAWTRRTGTVGRRRGAPNGRRKRGGRPSPTTSCETSTRGKAGGYPSIVSWGRPTPGAVPWRPESTMPCRAPGVDGGGPTCERGGRGPKLPRATRSCATPTSFLWCRTTWRPTCVEGALRYLEARRVNGWTVRIWWSQRCSLRRRVLRSGLSGKTRTPHSP
mmetsp:Transcript_1715/g.3685  ORF Transcript_1715/g.3685 Transcript_1715/m.3685 type:complete len:312 (+) Transcript_1715:323-1258(+)